MAHFVTQRWEGDPGAMGSRRARASFSFQAFVPDPIADLRLLVSFEAADAVARAEEAIRTLNQHASVIGLEAVGPLLLRSEAVASSRLENIDVSTFNLAHALIDPQHARGAAREVAANVAAMETAIAIGEKEANLSIEDLAELNRILMAESTRPQQAGHVRTVQNWIGGRLDNPSDAVYIPPPAGEVVRLLDDLVAFLNRADMPAIAQAAIAHAQFETIHPFEDGNGRTGRCLIHLILRRRGLTPHFVPPISIVLAARPTSYVAGLTGFREGKAVDWCLSFADAAGRAAETSLALARRVAELQAEWRGRAGNPAPDRPPPGPSTIWRPNRSCPQAPSGPRSARVISVRTMASRDSRRAACCARSAAGRTTARTRRTSSSPSLRRMSAWWPIRTTIGPGC